MAITFKALASGSNLTATPTVQYTVPAGSSASIQAVSVYNPTAAPVTFTMYRVPLNGVVADSYKICQRTVAPGTLIQGHEAINHKLESGGILMAMGDGLMLNVSGVEYVPDS